MNMPGTPEAATSTLDSPDDRSAPAPRAQVPRSVNVAFYAFAAALAVKVVRGIIAVFFPPTTKAYADFIEGMHFPTDPASSRSAAEAGHTAAIVNLVLIVVFVAVFYVVGRTMRSGANWARIVMAVFASLGILDAMAILFTKNMFAPVPVAGGPVGTALLVVLVASLGAYLVLAFRSSANRFFTAARR